MGLGSAHPSGVVQPHTQNFSKNQALLGAGAGLGLLPSSVKKREDRGLSQNKTEDKKLAQTETDQALTDKAVSGDDKKPEKESTANSLKDQKENKSTAKNTKEEDDKLRAKNEEDESRAKSTEDQKEGSSLAKDEKQAGQDSSKSSQNKKPNALKTGQDSRLKGSSSPTKAKASVESQKQKRRHNNQKKTASNAQSKTSSQKRASKNSSNSSKGAKTKASAKPIKTAQARSQSNKCPIPMPRIQSVIVFQSVEAPQIEPMGQQEEQTNPDKPSFKSYDLANRKPAGVLINLEKSKTLNKSFKIQLDMTYKNRKKHFSSCFHKPLEPHQKMIDTRQTECWLKESDFKGQTTHKFFGWHRKNSFLALSKRRDIHVAISLKSEDYPACQKTKSFKINIIKVQSVDIGWTGTSEKVCLRKEREDKNRVFKGYKFSAANRFKLVEDFIKSEEVSHYLEAMFPVYRVRSSFLENKSGSKILVVGSCDNSLPWKDAYITKGQLRDTLNLENWRQKEEYHKLVSVVPDDYFIFHGKHIQRKDIKPENISGLMIHPIGWEGYYYGGSFNIAFVKEDAFNIGVVAHELGHTLGQLEEFYNEQATCQRFNGSRLELCHKRQISIALDTKKENIRGKEGSIKKVQTWEFVFNKYSIMDNEGDIFNKWIDRETHQKMFKKLSLTKGGVTALKQSIPEQKKNLTNLFISAYYHNKKDTLIVPEMEIQKSNMMINSFPKKKSRKIPFLTFQLREKGKVLKEKRHPVLKMEAEFFYKDGDIKAFPFPASPFLAQFSLPADYKKRDLRVYVFNPQGKRIYKAPVLKRKKEERVVFIDKAY